MYSFNIEIAGYVIHAETIHTRPKAICRDFIVTNKPADIDIRISEADIDIDRKEYESNYDIIDPWEGFLEVSTLCRLVTNKLIELDTIMLHGAAIAYNQQSFIFSAPSGTGKTTHMIKWIRNLPGTFVVNGDKPFIKFLQNGDVMACGSPWAGKETIYTNTMVPLKAIIFMERAEDNLIEQITFPQAFHLLYQQVYHPADADRMRKTLRLMQRLQGNVNFYHFYCNNFKDNCFDVAYNALIGD